MIYKLFVVSLLLFMTSIAFGQDKVEDVVYLKDGTTIRGEILEYIPDEKIKIKTKDGSLLVYDSSEVTKIEKVKSKDGFQQYAVENPLHTKEKGWYHSIMGGTAFRIYNFGGLLNSPFGLGVDYSTGYQFNRYFGIGASIGVLAPGSEVFIPVSANLRGYLLKTSFNVFYDMNIGYGVSLTGIQFSGTRIGGLHFHPSIGVRFASNRKGHTILSLGYLIQIGGVNEYEIYAITTRVGVTF